MAAKQAGFWRRHRWLKWSAGGLLLVLIVLGIAISVALHRAEPILRAQIIAKLEQHFHARVELDSFHVSLVNGLWAEGKGLRIWPPADVAGVSIPGAQGTSGTIQPLIRLAGFRFHAPLHYKPGEAIRISVVELKGLDVDVPPKPHFRRAFKQDAPASGTSQGRSGSPLVRFEIDSIQCKDARLKLESSKPGKIPLEFAIAYISVTGINESGSMHFDARLTNPRPAGMVLTSGIIGPWAVEDPGETPITGEYRFEHADLGVFRGLAGTMTSTGKYQGALRDMAVDGQTDTPDFQLLHFGTAVPLRTQFHATVDGTNGDTWLQPVNATLGHSHLVAEGQVVGIPPVNVNGTTRPGGHEIALKVTVDQGRIEDFLHLLSKSGAPLLTGALTMKTALEIPPGTEPVYQRMRLNGNFVVSGAEFTSEKVQDKIGELSFRGQGRPNDVKVQNADVRSSMQSNFQMANGVVTLPDLKYTVPGAEINLNGTYGIDGGILHFVGSARTDATVSQMVGGWKGLLLKPADRFFKKNGAGTEVPIVIKGTREDPQFGVDLKQMKHSSPEVPGQTK